MDNNNEKVNTVFERLVVMGVNTKSKEITYENIINNNFTIDIIDIVPYLSLNKLPSYIEGLKDFLFPDGLKIYDEQLNVMNDPEPLDTFKLEMQFCKSYSKINPIHTKDLIFHFVTTDGDSTKRYCTALIFHEKVYIKNDMKYAQKKVISKCIPKIPLRQIIKNPLILDEDTDTIYIPKAICLVSRLPFFQTQRQFLHYYYHNIIMGRIIGYRKRIIPVPNKMINVFNGLILESGIKQAERIWDSNYYEIAKNFEKDIAIQYKVKETHLSEFYFSYIFHLLSIPKENRCIGLYRWYNQDKEKPEDLLLKCNLFTRETISPPNFSYGPLFRRNLTQINFLKIIKNILLERFIIIFSSSPGEIACLTESMLRLIMPLTHINIYVPFANLHHIWLLEAPGSSAIIGFSKAYKHLVMEKLQEVDRSGKVIVDLDDNTVEEDGILPSKGKSLLIKELTKLEQEFKSSRLKNNNAWDKTVVDIQRAFFNFMLSVLNDYTKFYKKEAIQLIENVTCDDDLENLRNQKYEIDSIFDKKEYLKIFPLEDQGFMRELIENTMMFPYFIAQTYEVLYLKKHKRKAIIEFHESLELVKSCKDATIDGNNTAYLDFENESITHKLIEEQNKYIQEITNLKEEKLSIYPYLIKWLKYLELFKLENLDAKKKKAEPVSFWKRFWSENILHFVNSEQRQQNRDQLNCNTMLYKQVDRRKFLNLQYLFEKSVLSGSFSLYQDRIKLSVTIKPQNLNIRRFSSKISKQSQQIDEDDSQVSNNSECASGFDQLNQLGSSNFLSQQCTPNNNERRTLYESYKNMDFINQQQLLQGQSRFSGSSGEMIKGQIFRKQQKHPTTMNLTTSHFAQKKDEDQFFESTSSWSSSNQLQQNQSNQQQQQHQQNHQQQFNYLQQQYQQQLDFQQQVQELQYQQQQEQLQQNLQQQSLPSLSSGQAISSLEYIPLKAQKSNKVDSVYHTNTLETIQE